MCKEMKGACGQIDIQKPDFVGLFSFWQYSYLYNSLLICLLYTQQRIQWDFDIADSVSSPKLWRLKKISKKAKV